MFLTETWTSLDRNLLMNGWDLSYVFLVVCWWLFKHIFIYKRSHLNLSVIYVRKQIMKIRTQRMSECHRFRLNKFWLRNRFPCLKFYLFFLWVGARAALTVFIDIKFIHLVRFEERRGSIFKSKSILFAFIFLF